MFYVERVIRLKIACCEWGWMGQDCRDGAVRESYRHLEVCALACLIYEHN